MYEVFLNEYQLVLATEINISSKDNIDKIIDIQNVADFFALLSAIEKNHDAGAGSIFCRISPELPAILPDNLRQIQAAGGLVTDRSGRFLFIRRWGRWDLPKGAVEKNESSTQAAIREVWEECGLDQLEIVKELPDTFHLYRSRHIRSANNWVLKKTSWFEMFHDGNGHTSPQVEEDIAECKWFEKSELEEALSSTYAGLRKMLRSYFAG